MNDGFYLIADFSGFKVVFVEGGSRTDITSYWPSMQDAIQSAVNARQGEAVAIRLEAL